MKSDGVGCMEVDLPPRSQGAKEPRSDAYAQMQHGREDCLYSHSVHSGRKHPIVAVPEVDQEVSSGVSVGKGCPLSLSCGWGTFPLKLCILFMGKKAFAEIDMSGHYSRSG